jgi:hypothetical protein
MEELVKEIGTFLFVTLATKVITWRQRCFRHTVPQSLPSRYFQIHHLSTTPLPESARKLNRQSDRRLSAKLEPTFGDRRCRVVSVTEP